MQPRDPEREGEAAKAVREFAGVRHIAAMGREVQQYPRRVVFAQPANREDLCVASPLSPVLQPSGDDD